MTTHEKVLDVLGRYFFVASTEAELQDGIAGALADEGLAVEREVILNPQCRLDLLVDDVAIEVKVAGGWRALQRQVDRYVEQERVGSVVVVTTKPMHGRLPTQANGKRVSVHFNGRGGL